MSHELRTPLNSIIGLHGGTIGAESRYGHGSTFWFLLPVDGPVRHHAP
jgi:signal transduction histidine kinase